MCGIPPLMIGRRGRKKGEAIRGLAVLLDADDDNNDEDRYLR